MAFNRRSILKSLGLAPAAALANSMPNPDMLLGLEGITGMAGEQSKFGSYTVAESAITLGRTSPPEVVETFSGIELSKQSIAKRVLSGFFKDALKGKPLPPALERSFREEHNGVFRLDPDIVSMRSLSLTAKFRIQRERNLKKAMENSATEFDYHIERRIFDKLYNIELY